MNETTTIWTVKTIVSIPVVIVLILQCLITNILVIYSVFTFPPLKTPQNLLLVSLATADISNAIFVMPLNAFWKVVGKWPFNKAVCVMHLTSDSYLCTTSNLNLVVIALDRYWAIFDPIKHYKRRSTKFMIKIALCAWAVAFVITVVPCTALPFIFNIFPWPEDDCYYPRGYILYVTWGQFVIPLIIMSIIYYLIYGAILKQLEWRRSLQKASDAVIVMEPKRSSKTSQSSNITEVYDELVDVLTEPEIDRQPISTILSTSERIRSREVVNECEKISFGRERNAVRLLSIIVVVFFVCWAPYFILDNIFFFWPSLLPKTPVSIINIIYWLGYANSACNPIIYTVFNRDFRNAFKRVSCGRRHDANIC